MMQFRVLWNTFKKTFIWFFIFIIFLIINYLIYAFGNFRNEEYLFNMLLIPDQAIGYVLLFKILFIIIFIYQFYIYEVNNNYIYIFNRINLFKWLNIKYFWIIIMVFIYNTMYVIALYFMFNTNLDLIILYISDIIIVDFFVISLLILVTNISYLKKISVMIISIITILLPYIYNCYLFIALGIIFIIINYIIVIKFRALKYLSV